MSKRLDEMQLELRKIAMRLPELRAIENPNAEQAAEISAAATRVRELSARIADERALDDFEERARTPEAAPPAPTAERGSSFGRFLQAVASNYGANSERNGYLMPRTDARAILTETRAPSGMSEAVPSDGGFLVGSQQGALLAERIWDQANIAGLCDRVPLSGPFDGIKYPFIDETSRANGSRSGGVLAYWKNEAAATTASKPKIGEQTMNLEKLFALCYVTDELLQDATALESLIMREFQREMTFKVVDAILNGTGAGQPLGILNAPCLAQAAKVTGQTARTITFENIVQMYSQLWSGAQFISTRWIMNRSCIPQIMALSIKVGSAGYPLYVPGNSLAGTPNGTLLGIPVIYAEQCQTLGTAGDIYLADLSQYRIIDKAGVQAASSMHVNFTTDEMAFRFTMRVNGQPLWKSAVTPYKDASTSQPVSPFVALAVRA